MKAYGKNWRLVDDPICDLEEWNSVPVDCTDCEYFFDCYEEDYESYEDHLKAGWLAPIEENC